MLNSISSASLLSVPRTAIAASGPTIAAFGLLVVMGLFAGGRALRAQGLETDLGRNETRVYAARLQLPVGVSIGDLGLVDRLEQRGYRRVGSRPGEAGQYFWGRERFWIYRRAYGAGRRLRSAELFGLELDEDGRIEAVLGADGSRRRDQSAELDPVLLAESLSEARVLRRAVRLEDLPDHLWRPLLAAEDARFFDHRGLDGRSIARALVANVRAGRVEQGGSTITQQLIKMRDLSPQRSLGRKASEAMRALDLEAEYDKEKILEAYLNHVYYGHVDGHSIYGIEAAARTFFSRSAARLDLAQSTLLAAVVQSPNRYSPVRNPTAVEDRYEWILGRLGELGWAAAGEVTRARRSLPRLRLTRPTSSPDRFVLAHLASETARLAPRRDAAGRGVVIETSLDAYLQRAATEAVADGLESLRRRNRRLRSAPLSAALVVLDAETGDILAHVGGDPRGGDSFDRVRAARRQPGSAVKPLVLLEAFEDCGPRRPLYPARSVSDRPLRIDLPSGPWTPVNPDGRHRPEVTVREAMVQSLNLPLVRVAEWCGRRNTARRMRRAGLALDKDPPPAFVLGAIETSPLELAAAYSALASDGRSVRPRVLTSMRRPSGGGLATIGTRRRRVVSADTSYLIRDILVEALERRATGLPTEARPFGKTGTSSDRRDAWFAGAVGSVVAVVWVGLDDGTSLGLFGSQAAFPMWSDFMDTVARVRRTGAPPRPATVVERWIDEESGLLVQGPRRGASSDLFHDRSEPRQRKWWRPDPPVEPIG